MAGATQQVEFEGQVHEFPSDFTDADIQKALGSHAPAQPDSSIPKWYGFTPGNVAKNAWQGAKGVVEGIGSVGKDLATNPNWVFGKDSTYEKFIGKPAEAEANKASDAWKQGRYSEAAGHELAGAIPLVGPWAASLGEQVGTGDIGGAAGNAAGTALAGAVTGKVAGKVADVPGDVSALRDVAKYSKAADQPFRVGLQAITHDILNKAADGAKQKLWDAHNMVSARVGMLKDDIANADIQTGEPKIPIGDLIPKIDQLAADYKAAGGVLPSFDKAVKAIANRESPYLSFEEAADLRTEIGSLSAKAAKGTRDAGATAELEQALKGKLTDRAAELDMSKQFESYNGLWSTLKGYEENGPIGKLQNAPTGYDFFNALRDPKTGSALRRSVDSLSDFGLPKTFVSDLIKDNGKLHDYAKSTGGSLGFAGRMKALAHHPVVGGLGGTLGKAAFGWPGGVLGTIGGSELADSVSAAREIRKAGGPPDTTGEMKQFDAQPSGKPLERGAKPDPTVKNELIQALKSQGLDSKAATAAAIRAIQKNPKGDFGQLFSDAIRRP